MDTSLEGIVAVVTGAGAGIGRGCALALAEAGAVVAVTDVNGKTAEETHELIKAAGLMSAPYTLDVTDDAAWGEVMARLRKEHGSIRVLVNNAALKGSAVGDGGLLVTSISAWDNIMATNLRGPMLGSRNVLPDMIAAGSGSIIMMTSASALRAVPNFATAYSSAKAGMIGLTQCLAVSYGTKGVRCNAIAPGVIMMVSESASQEAFSRSSSGLLQRTGVPADVANLVVFLASDKGSYVNGQTITVDGGLTTHMPALSPK